MALENTQPTPANLPPFYPDVVICHVGRGIHEQDLDAIARRLLPSLQPLDLEEHDAVVESPVSCGVSLTFFQVARNGHRLGL